MKKAYTIILLLLFGCGMFCSEAQTTVKMEQFGGVYKIPCKVNGLPLKFIFDPGASDISISLTEALFMLKNEYLSEKDIMGKEYYSIANGDIQEGTKINIKCIEVGGLKIYNVQASITHTDNAPLLFGQSALKRFGKFSMDYATNTLLLGGVNNMETAVTPSPPIIAQASQKVCKDIDGNTYKTVKIGTQIWMAENLRTAHFNDGSFITENEEEAVKSISGSITSAWCYYNGDAANNPIYGKLYNWYAVADPRNLCPTGWHVPTDYEWTLLSNYLGGTSAKKQGFYGWVDTIAGGHMKAINKLWTQPNTGADNSSGFTALPAGSSYNLPHFKVDLGSLSIFWTSTQSENEAGWCYELQYNNSYLNRDGNKLKSNGYSVRCIAD